MLYRSNLFFLVGGGQNPKWANTKAIIWDDAKKLPTGELLFQNPILKLAVKQTELYIVTEEKIFTYNFKDQKMKRNISTFRNPYGLCEIIQDVESDLMIYPVKVEEIRKT